MEFSVLPLDRGSYRTLLGMQVAVWKWGPGRCLSTAALGWPLCFACGVSGAVWGFRALLQGCPSQFHFLSSPSARVKALVYIAIILNETGLCWRQMEFLRDGACSHARGSSLSKAHCESIYKLLKRGKENLAGDSQNGDGESQNAFAKWAAESS